MSGEVIDILAGFNAAVPQDQQAKSLRVDISKLGQAMAEAMAADMRDNLYGGKTPDGTGSMPRGKTTGKPRGQGSDTARSIKAKPSGDDWIVVAEEDDRGTLGRILRGIPFQPPETSKRQQEVRDKAADIAVVN